LRRRRVCLDRDCLVHVGRVGHICPEIRNEFVVEPSHKANLGVRHFSQFSRSGLRLDCSALCFDHGWRVSNVTASEPWPRYGVAVRHNLHRYYGAGDLHFITCSCYRRQPLLGTPRRRHLFLKVLEQVRKRYAFVVVGYVVMPEHVHLLISEPQEKNPWVVMQALKVGFARRVLAERRHSHRSQANLFEHAAQHVWQKRFYDFNVWTARKRVEKLRYMHRNPVQRGLVASPELWRWSSFRAYLFGEAGPVAVNKWDVLKMKIRAPAA
jgi:putative transposase